jgi:hypothetical protein
MSVLWCGGEDIDFPNGNTVSVTTATQYFRTGWSRCSLGFAAASYTLIGKSTVFSGGAITSGWLSCRMVGNSGTFLVSVQPRLIGFGKSGSNNCLVLGSDINIPNKLALHKFDGTTDTQLAAEIGTSLIQSTMFRLEMQVINYGTTATVNVYLNSILVITYTGDVTVTGMTNFDSVFIFRSDAITLNDAYFSEIMVADEDPRGWVGLQTLALTGAGTTSQWTGLFSTINQTTISDTTPNYTNVVAQDQQFNVTDLIAGTYSIRAVKISARAATVAGSTATKISLGFNSGGTIAVGPAQVPAVAYTTMEQLNLINPVTGNPWLPTEITPLQLDLRSS